MCTCALNLYLHMIYFQKEEGECVLVSSPVLHIASLGCAAAAEDIPEKLLVLET
jgi:hypothetical protein